MSKDMKLIMESWRKNVIQEDYRNVPGIHTFGDLKKALETAIQARRKNLAKGELKNTGADIIMGLIPGGGAIKNIFQVVKNTYSMDDKKKTNSGLDNLNVDDELSAIVDDRIEVQFLKDLAEFVASEPPDTPMQTFDVNKRLRDFIARKYSQRTVELPSGGN